MEGNDSTAAWTVGNVSEEPLPVLANAPTFTSSTMVKTLVLTVIAAVALAGNAATLVSIHRSQRNVRSTVYLLLSQLAVADLFVAAFCVAAEAIWTSTVQWLAGTVMCKIIKYLQMFSLYLSTFILVLIGLDRYVAVRYPLWRPNAHRSCHTLILFVWVFSFFISIPQVIIFQVQRGPFLEDFYQCVTYGSYSAPWQEQLYVVFTLLFTFILPLLILIIAYIGTFRSISHSEWTFREETAQTHAGVIRQKLLRKAKTKSLKLTVVIVSAFVICWTPYYIMSMVFMFMDPDECVSEDFKSAVFFFGMSNSMVNPLIYGAFHLRGAKRLLRSRRRSQSTLNTGSSARRTNVVGLTDYPSACTVIEDAATGGPLRTSVKFRTALNRSMPNPYHHESDRDVLKDKCTSF